MAFDAFMWFEGPGGGAVLPEGETTDEKYKANKAGFVIHSAIHMAREDAMCVWHMHTLAGMAVSAQEEGLQPAHMYSHNFWNRLSYHDFEGPAMRLDERTRVARSLGASNQALMKRRIASGFASINASLADISCMGKSLAKSDAFAITRATFCFSITTPLIRLETSAST